MDIQEIEYAGVSKNYRGLLAGSDGANESVKKPGVLIFPDAWGLTPFAEAKAKQVAQLGYVVLACDMYGGGQRAGTLDEAGEFANRLRADDASMADVTDSAIKAISDVPGVDRDRIAVVGFCLGGAVALSVARRGIQCRAVTSFHGLLQPTRVPTASPLTTKILVCTGADDPLVPLTDVVAFQNEMSNAKADCQIVIYTGAGHSFSRPDAAQRPGFGYDEAADRRSWRSMVEHLQDAFV